MVIRSPEESTREILNHHVVELQMFLGWLSTHYKERTFSSLQRLQHPTSAAPHHPGTRHSGSFYFQYNHPASWQSWSADLGSSIETPTDVDISPCVLVSLTENPLVQEFKVHKFQMQTPIPIFMSWLLSRMLQLVNTGGCWQVGPFPAPCWRRACSDKLLLSFLQQLMSSVSSRVKARQCAGRGLVELVKSPSAGIRPVLRNHGPVKKEVHTLISFWAIFHHSDEQIQVQCKKEMAKWKVNEMKEQWFL